MHHIRVWVVNVYWSYVYNSVNLINIQILNYINKLFFSVVYSMSSRLILIIIVNHHQPWLVYYNVATFVCVEIIFFFYIFYVTDCMSFAVTTILFFMCVIQAFSQFLHENILSLSSRMRLSKNYYGFVLCLRRCSYFTYTYINFYEYGWLAKNDS
jgi:hypothetical protein